MNLLDNAKFYVVAPQTTGSTDEQAAVVLDSAGYDNVMWLAIADGNTNSTGGYSVLRHMHSESTSTTDMVAATSTTLCAPASTGTGFLDNTMLVLDVHRPSKRYVSAYLTKDSTNAFDSEILGILYNTERGSVTQPTSTYGVAGSAFSLSPTT